jgi:recombinational DNA repair protein (RecF pathway)
MTEIVTEAIVLSKEPRREIDNRIFLFTESHGLLVANATSTRKPTSKLSAHLEPLNLVQVRIVKKNNFQITDALKIGSLPKTSEALSLLNFVKTFFSHEEPDRSVWNVLRDGSLGGQKISTRAILHLLGFDPESAECSACNKKNLLSFSVSGYFFCINCKSRRNSSEVFLDATLKI